MSSSHVMRSVTAALCSLCLFAACSLSELSSLHDLETDFRQTYRQVQKKALPAIPDVDDTPDLLTSDLSPPHEGRHTRQPQRRLCETDDSAQNR